MVYAMQCLGQLAVGYAFTTVPNMIISITILLCGQYDILFCNLKNIRNTAMLKNNINNRHQLK